MEALYYNAVAVAMAGDYDKIAKLRKRSGGNWKYAYEKFLRGGAAGNAEAEWRKLEERGVRLIMSHEKEFSPLLREMERRPFGVYVRGAAPALSVNDRASDVPTPFAIVGTRRATPEGKTIARRFARELAQAGFPIVSGLAFGIDAAAHEGCLEARGTTIAVLAGGLGAIYPRENGELAERILENGGAIISEYPINSPPYPGRFLERNRIISGLSRGVLIVEAPAGAGSLATARRALEQNRDVFVVPGAIAHPNFAGSNQLIRQGATLVTSPEEILEAYGIAREEKIAAAAAAGSSEEKLILKALRELKRPADVDKIAAMTKLEPRIANRALSFLLLNHLIKEEGGGYTI